MINPNKQKGAAVIVALFLTALVAAMAIAMIERLRIDTRRTQLLLNAYESLAYAKGSVAWAKDQLNQNWKTKRDKQRIDPTPISMQNLVSNFLVTNIITDSQGFFNLNNLTSKDSQTDFVKLILLVDPKMNQQTAEKLVLGIVDWISTGAKNNSYDRYYSEQHPSYTAPHRLMTNVSELRLVQGVTQNLYNALLPFITVLPASGTLINVNSAEAPVIACLSANMTLASARSIISYRQKNPFISLEQFTNFEIVKNNPIPENKITVTSNYFLVQSTVTIGQQTTTLNSLLDRKTKETDAKTRIIWQTQGSM